MDLFRVSLYILLALYISDFEKILICDNINVHLFNRCYNMRISQLELMDISQVDEKKNFMLMIYRWGNGILGDDENCIRHTRASILFILFFYCKRFDLPFITIIIIIIIIFHCVRVGRKSKSRVCLTRENWFILIIISSCVNTRIQLKNELTSAGFFLPRHTYSNILIVYRRRYA